MSVFPGLANTGMNHQRTWHGGNISLSFCLLRGLNSSLSGDVLSCDILQILPGWLVSQISIMGKSYWIYPTWEPYYKFLNYPMKLNINSVCASELQYVKTPLHFIFH